MKKGKFQSNFSLKRVTQFRFVQNCVDFSYQNQLYHICKHVKKKPKNFCNKMCVKSEPGFINETNIVMCMERIKAT